MRLSALRLATQAAKQPHKLQVRSRMPQSSYYKNYQPGAALLRARNQYIIPNAITGVCIVAFVLSVYAYTIKAVSQDDFEDVPIPDVNAKRPDTR